jgi:hypothetical protein
MKEITLPSRINMLVANLLGTDVQKEKPVKKSRPGKDAPTGRLERQARKELYYYKPVTDQDTQEIAGHLSDISTGGFKLDSLNPIPVNRDFRFRMNLTSEVADKPSMIFVARSKWCKVDPLDPYVYNVGYQLIHISPGDLEIFNRIMEKYGREPSEKTDLRRSNKW